MLPGSDPSLEAVVDPSSPWQLSVLAELGDAAGVMSTVNRRHRSLCGRLGVREPARDALWDAAVASTRAGSKTLKNLLISGRNPLVEAKNRFGRHCDECASRGMRRSRALKAVARKESGVTYAIIRNWVPYEEPSSGADAEKSPITV